ncbi:hypothetical protein LGK97_17900 [Clostridium sp. CS001]|uniref:hypothetical protein n=1 Tax=Clostridium sp. CS001 TaxID=2880648 RepID=UPI001CF5A94A|nr:hypothetical protein [Clostridium sp. CS001]MCB2291591.1 hypothetical protein [Clostridium sp. CS001]
MEIREKINQLFVENNENLNKTDIEKELIAMRNAQPPTYPTFMVGQQEVKDTLKQQLLRCFENKAFFHTVIAGEVGGGKTHLLNLIKSRFNDGFCYTVQFRAEETDQTQYSFPKMIVATLFKRYYDDFKQIFLNINLDEVINKYEEFERANGIASCLDISVNLAEALYQYISQSDRKSSAIRIIGGCENIRDLAKLKINKLTDEDYMNVIQLFLQYNKKMHYLLVMLDEFEHSYTLFTPAKRRDFLKGYKAFLDRFSKNGSWALILITAATVQYKGQLQESLIKIDTALASRLEPQTLMLEQFKIGFDEDFKKLYKEIAWRYKEVYGYDVGYEGAIKMRKRIFQKWETESAQQKTYREVITTMIILMEEMERKGQHFYDKDEELKEEIGSEKNVLEAKSDKRIEILESKYILLKKELEEKWNAKINARITMIKKGIESLLENYIDDFENKKIGLGRGGSSTICFNDRENNKKYIYIALQELKDKLASCKKTKEKLQKDQGDNLIVFFVYLPGEDIEEQFKNYPDIIPINIDAIRLDLMILGNKNDLDIEVKTTVLKKLEQLSLKLIGKGLDKNV